MSQKRIAGHLTGLRQLADGARPALALHCSLAHGGAWGPLAQALQAAGWAESRLIAPDLPGHGASDPPGDQDLHALSTRIAVALAEEAGGPVDLIGHSFGGTLALRLTLERPDLVRSLTLVEPVIFAAARETAGGEALYEQTRASQEHVAQVLAQDPASAAAQFHAIWGGGVPFAALSQRQQDNLSSHMYLVTTLSAILLDDAAGLLRPGRLEGIGVPVLLAAGGASPAVIQAIHQALAARIPDVQAITVPGAAHMLPITHPQPLAEAMASLLSRS
ncbi:alpha/beta fold hydrolase [Pseudogemmobacter hezensis]|uniref:alpha/beta fold hydrolase n=1 Tax=Pseudogemmobacter hezensis TaxID=2737662 RepID=UPI0034592005